MYQVQSVSVCNSLVAIAGQDGVVTLWNFRDNAVHKWSQAHLGNPVRGIFFTRSPNTLVTTGSFFVKVKTLLSCIFMQLVVGHFYVELAVVPTDNINNENVRFSAESYLNSVEILLRSLALLWILHPTFFALPMWTTKQFTFCT